MINDLKAGDRIRLVQMGDDPCPIEPGTTGTVISQQVFECGGPGGLLAGSTSIAVNWDNGRSLALVCPPDTWERLGSPLLKG